MDLLFDGDVKVLDKMPVKFERDCSKERFAEALMALSSMRPPMIDEDHGATAVCHFVGTSISSVNAN